MTTSPPVPRPVAVVTGASSGIGEAFARRYAREGFDLVLVARSRSTLEALAAELTARHQVTVDVHPADLAEPDDLTRLVAAVTDGLPRLDHLVNCAGVAMDGDLADSDDTALARMVDVNIVALTLLTKAAVARMRAAGAGTVVNIASTAAYQPMPHIAAYSATKSYVLMLTAALSEEVRKHGVRVVAVSPGSTDTPMNPATARGWRQPEQVVETAWKALTGTKPAVVDGWQNRGLAVLSARLLPPRLRLRIAERMMRHRA